MNTTIFDNKQQRNCIFIKDNGKHCGAKAMRGSEFCYFHNPQVEAERIESKRNGGKNKILVVNGTEAFKPVKLENPKQVTKFYAKIVNDVLSGEMDLRISTGIGYLLNGLLKSMEMSELTERLENIEGMINKIDNK